MPTILFLLAVSIGLLLIVPLDFVFSIQHNGTNCKEIGLIWLLGLVRVRLLNQDNVPDATAKKKRVEKDASIGPRKAVSMLRNADLRHRIVRYAGRLIQAIRIVTLDLRVQIGLDNPADTGRLWGAIGPLAGRLAGLRRTTVFIEPDFTEEVFAIQSHGRIRIIPLEVISVSLLFFLSPNVIYAIAAKS